MCSRPTAGARGFPSCGPRVWRKSSPRSTSVRWSWPGRQSKSLAGRARCYVAGSIGPLGASIEPLGSNERGGGGGALRAAGFPPCCLGSRPPHPGDFRRRAGACRPRSAASARHAIFPSSPPSRSTARARPSTARSRRCSRPSIDELGPDVIGLNCSEGPRVMLEAAEKMVRVTRRPLCIQPNAGVPVNVERPQYLPDHAQVHGEVCQAHDPVRSAHGGRLLRHHARAHQGDPERDPRPSPGVLPEAIRVVVPEAGQAAGRPGEKKRLGRARLPGGSSSPAWSWCHPKGWSMEKLVENALTLEKGNRCGQRPRQPPGPGQDGRASWHPCSSSRRRGSRPSPTTRARTRTSWPSRRTSWARTRWASATSCWSPATLPTWAPIPMRPPYSTWMPSGCASW